MMRKPAVLIPACNRMLGQHPFHIAGKKYIDAVRLAGCLPIIAPASDAEELDELLALADGILLTGSPSNVHPDHFGEAVHDPELPLDPGRDSWTLAIIPRALQAGIPLFAICRGFQETNVALGGSLHQAVHEAEGHHDHRGAPDAPVEVVYAPAHAVTVQPDGTLARILGGTPFARDLTVNSIHGQGIKQLAPGLRVEAVAPDGLVEAFSQPDAPGFNLCVQWHPEWQAADNPVSVQLFHAFGAACQSYRNRHRAPQRDPDR